jgi:hypothetical protein
MRTKGLAWRGLIGFLAASALTVGVGCDSGPPDTGAGAHETPPAAVNCADLCHRATSCLVLLCNEDTSSTRYTGLGEALDPECVASCSEPALQSKITADQWRCVFESSCRQVFGNDSCHAMSHYNCT